MKVCVFGVGSVGGMAAGHMLRAGIDVTLFARGATLTAIRTRGLKIVGRRGSWTVPAFATDDPAQARVQDVIILTVKAHAIAAALDRLLPLIGPETVVVTVVNGIPWWYFHACPGDWPKRHLDSVDPGGRVWRAIGPEKALGGVVYCVTNCPEPGVVEDTGGHRFVIGEPDGRITDRAKAVSELFVQAGLKSPIAADIRAEVWAKLWGNLSGNPLSVLTEATCDRLAGDDAVAGVMTAMMTEAATVARRLGVAAEPDIPTWIRNFAAIGPFQTSMLQDFRAGKPIELDPILGAVVELARMVGVETPILDTVHALVRQKAQIAGCYVPLQSAKENSA